MSPSRAGLTQRSKSANTQPISTILSEKYGTQNGADDMARSEHGEGPKIAKMTLSKNSQSLSEIFVGFNLLSNFKFRISQNSL